MNRCEPDIPLADGIKNQGVSMRGILRRILFRMHNTMKTDKNFIKKQNYMQNGFKNEVKNNVAD